MQCYLTKVRQNPLLHKVLSVFAAAAAAVWPVFCFAHILGLPQLVGLWIISFIAFLLPLLPAKPIFQSVQWFVKTIYYLLAGCCQWYVLRMLFRQTIRNLEGEGKNQLTADFWVLIGVACFIFAALLWVGGKILNVFRDTRLGKWASHWLLIFTPHLKYEKKPKAERKKLEPTGLLAAFLYLLALVFLIVALVIAVRFPTMGFEAILFTVRFSNGSVSRDLMLSFFLYAVLAVTATILFYLAYLRRYNSDSIYATSLDGKQQIQISIVGKIRKYTIRIVLCFLLCTAFVLERSVGLDIYLISSLRFTEIYEQHYVKPEGTLLAFPEDKPNLIYLYLESYEFSYTTKENGGCLDTDLMPELLQLAKDNLNFSYNTSIAGQSVFFDNVAYTMASTVAQTGGVPLVIPTYMTSYREYADDPYVQDINRAEKVLPGLMRLEDILYDNGYNQMFIRGEDARFAGYRNYVGQYENSVIFDHYQAIQDGVLPEDYYAMWGYEDTKLFEYAKERITKLSKEPNPFCVTLYTADTHGSENGYRCEQCDPSIGDQLEAAIRCTSKQTGNFINWLKEQEFFEDTVIILVGDHLMETGDIVQKMDDDSYTRTTYNCIINARKVPEQDKNRLFTTMDMFPTTLSAIGVEIKGDRLGLGTDLFSETPTLCEEMGEKAFLDEIMRNTSYYSTNFWAIAEQ